MRKFSNCWLKSVVDADTGIGRTVEALLGIQMNASKDPDYKGIELKTARKKATRTTLFSKTPDWQLSACKSTHDILRMCGYRNPSGGLTYRNTLVYDKPNSQGLFLLINNPNDYLEIKQEKRPTPLDVAVWRLETLHDTLKKKHAETFWITADSRKDNGFLEFQIKSITHSRKPIMSQFDFLLLQRFITVDLLLGRGKHGDTYAFKLKKGGVPLLFPEPKVYDL